VVVHAIRRPERELFHYIAQNHLRRNNAELPMTFSGSLTSTFLKRHSAQLLAYHLLHNNIYGSFEPNHLYRNNIRQGQDLAVTVLHVPCSLNSGSVTTLGR